MITVKYDDHKAVQVLQDLQRATGEDMEVVVSTESRRLATACMKASPPRNRSKLARKIKGEVSALFTDNYEANIDPGHQGGDSSMKWIIAGPHFLYGLPPKLDLRGRGEIIQEYRSFKDAGGKRITTIGRRGKQKVYAINRLVADKAAVRNLVKRLVDNIGRAKAAWAQAASILGETDIPGWISKHFPTPKGVLTQSGSGVGSSVTIGSRAPGVGKQSAMYKGVFRRRINSMKARIKLINSGYAKDVAEGIRPQKHAADVPATE